MVRQQGRRPTMAGERLVTLITDRELHEIPINHVAGEIETLAKDVGKAVATKQILKALQHPKGGDLEAAKEASRMLTMGADDSWSGRTNDVKRAYHDGVRQVAGRAVEDF